MIKTIEIAPDIVAHELADYLYKEYGCILTNDYEECLACYSQTDLREVIRKFFNDS